MSNWEIISEEASIVLVGNMNPKIFHPEWFIRKGIVEEWDYNPPFIMLKSVFGEFAGRLGTPA